LIPAQFFAIIFSCSDLKFLKSLRKTSLRGDLSWYKNLEIPTRQTPQWRGFLVGKIRRKEINMTEILEELTSELIDSKVVEHVVFELPRVISLECSDRVWLIRDHEGDVIALSGDSEGALSVVAGLSRARRINNAWAAFKQLEIEGGENL
jgi:hypothetical protein